MKKQKTRITAILSSVFGGIGVLGLGLYVYIREQARPILFSDPALLSGDYAPGDDRAFEPMGLFHVSDERLHLWLLVACFACAAIAIFLGIGMMRRGARDHYSATGFALGLIGVVWSGMITVGFV
ncbi:MAG: hypothetical protein QNI99_10880 [Woeseiaceae bacterium]|nr:hypothetical protein [Woeseiaceae bacterium]